MNSRKILSVLFLIMIAVISDAGAQVPSRYKFVEVNSGVTNNLFSILNNQIISGSNGLILYSSNNGLNWSQLSQLTNNNIYTVFNSFQNGSKITAAGEGGVIFISNNFGQNWIQETSPVTANLYGGAFTFQVLPIAIYRYIAGENGTI